MDSKNKTIVVGLDAATNDLIKPWVAEGKLPTLARLMREEAAGDLEVQVPPSSISCWPSFSTGKNPGKHSVTWWVRQTDSAAKQEVCDRRSMKGKSVWDIAGAMGKRVAIVNMTVSYPPQPVNGLMVTGMLTPNGVDYTYPQDLAAELERETDYLVTHNATYRKGGEQQFLDALLEMMEKRTQACLHMMEKYEWDLFIVVFTATDLVMHKFWKEFDPNHPHHDPAIAAKFKDAIYKVYEAADDSVDRLLTAAGENTNKIVLSDHGSGAIYQTFLVNNWLLQKGWLKIKRDWRTRFKHLLFSLGFTVNNVYPLANRVVAMVGGKKVRKKLDRTNPDGSILYKLFLSEHDIDWERTQAYSMGAFGQIFINVKGRFPEGIVERGAEYDALRAEIIRELKQVKIPQTGNLYAERVVEKEEVYHGEAFDRMPDVLCIPADMRYVDLGLGFVSNKLFDEFHIISGTHYKTGVLLAEGPDIQGNVDIQGANIIDLAPTILYLMGLPIPDDMDGKVLTQIIDEALLKNRPIEFVEASTFETSEGDDVESLDDSEEVMERLRALGYIS